MYFPNSNATQLKSFKSGESVSLCDDNIAVVGVERCPREVPLMACLVVMQCIYGMTTDTLIPAYVSGLSSTIAIWLFLKSILQCMVYTINTDTGAITRLRVVGMPAQIYQIAAKIEPVIQDAQWAMFAIYPEARKQKAPKQQKITKNISIPDLTVYGGRKISPRQIAR